MLFVLLLFPCYFAQTWDVSNWTNCDENGFWTRTVSCDTTCTPPAPVNITFCTWNDWGDCYKLDSNCVKSRTFSCNDPSDGSLCPDFDTVSCDSLECLPRMEDLGTGAMVAGVIVSLLLLIFTCIGLSVAWCRYEKRYFFAYRLTQAEKMKRLREERDQTMNVDHDTAFKQQQLPSWTPKPDLFWVLATYITVAIWCIPIGIILLEAAKHSNTQEIRYDNLAQCDISQNTPTQLAASEPYVTCDVSFEIEHDMAAPVYVYYKLTHFFQNHRSYAKSVDEKQLRNSPSAELAPDNCDPLVKYGSWSDKNQPGYNASYAKLVLYPCGLLAQSFFNDIFYPPTICPTSGPCELLTGRNWQKNGIAWQSDLDIRFKPRPLKKGETNMNPRGFQMPPVDDEDFVVWMRAAIDSTFTKIHRQVLDRSFKKGERLNLTIENRFPSWKWGGSKSIVLATVNFAGGNGSKNLGIIHVFIGILSLMTALCIWGRSECIKRGMWSPMGDDVDKSRHHTRSVASTVREDDGLELQEISGHR